MGQQHCVCTQSDLAKADKVPVDKAVDPPSGEKVCADASDALDVTLKPGAVSCVEVPIVLRQAEGYPDVRVFLTPQRGSAVVGEIPSQTEAECVGEWGEFVRVRWKQLEGWVGRKNVFHLGTTALKRGVDSFDVGIWSRETTLPSKDPKDHAVQVSLALRDLVCRETSEKSPASKPSSPFSKASSDTPSWRRSARTRKSRSPPGGGSKSQEFSFGEDCQAVVTVAAPQPRATSKPSSPKDGHRPPLSPSVDTGNMANSVRSRSNSAASVGSPNLNRMQEAKSLLANMLTTGDSPERREATPTGSDSPERRNSKPVATELPGLVCNEGESEASGESLAATRGGCLPCKAAAAEATPLHSINGCMPWFPPSTDHKLRVGQRP
mmetsp:Transcript_29627/g.48516  ORF Transcript_29627/g.48516 Transcript_29627/m.48516 type:complete len:380 (-) Transcript_29627:97-1236(-)